MGFIMTLSTTKKILYVVVYSHVGNTGSFVARHLQPQLEAVYEGVEVIYLHSEGPHRALQEEPRNLSSVYKHETEFLLVFPCYGRRDFETGELSSTVPLPVKQFVEKIESEDLGEILGAVVCGNRTFGSDFARVDESLNYETLHKVELAGSRTEAEAVITALKERENV